MLPTVVLCGLLGLLGADSANGKTEDHRPCVQKIRIGGPVESRSKCNFEAFDHASFDALLHRFVDCNGMVCYRDWKKDCDAVAQLHAYLTALGQVNTRDAKASAAGQLAFYINAYNALVIWGILHDYPVASIQALNRKNAEYRIFDDLELWIDGEYLSLNTMEHEILRALGEPRIHFALVCAAKGCPRLRCEAYTRDRLEEQLTDNAIDFFSRSTRFQVCRVTKTVKLSPILQWFREDFGTADQAILVTILPYVPEKDRDWLLDHLCASLRFLGYNWALNDQCPTPGVRAGSVPYVAYARFEPWLRPLLRVVKMPSLPSDNEENASDTAPAAPKSEPAAPAEPPPPRALEPTPVDPFRPISPPAPPRALEPKEDSTVPSPTESKPRPARILRRAGRESENENPPKK